VSCFIRPSFSLRLLMYFDVVIQKESKVIMTGYSTCSNCEPLSVPTIWTAKVENDLLSE